MYVPIVHHACPTLCDANPSVACTSAGEKTVACTTYSATLSTISHCTAAVNRGERRSIVSVAYGTCISLTAGLPEPCRRCETERQPRIRVRRHRLLEQHRPPAVEHGLLARRRRRMYHDLHLRAHAVRLLDETQ